MATIVPHRSKGRPRTFDRDAALNRALNVFWQRGYEPATIADLCAAMEINPPSLYAAFGNKAQLFMEAVHHYERVYWDAIWDRMEQGSDVKLALSGFFHEAAGILTSQDVPCGCLVILAATNVSAEGREVNEALRAMRQEGRNCFLTRLQRAVSDGQFSTATDVDSLASTLNAMLEGMSLLARDGGSREELDRIATTAMMMLPASAGH
ncbi:MAG: TetR/AcrR family transcriptional regulator [Mesorhizobium sp.]|uniref:TetR/AcrR family transcriptional regulator n=1 Tax=Mesorhizobium sp. TaxID=1871066 RepID=UPI001AD22C80|nr:TetR/AcrR family transcriptional regulator [Mesorhizobium sp.]MBN9217265.1 TetR/AcrR family transcriptional regulator [Mesorhizobium sp.]